jgi:hypothetical protein
VSESRSHRDRNRERDHDPDSVGELLSGERLRMLMTTEPGLWPVVAVLAIVAVTFGVTLLTLAIRGGSVFAAAIVALLVLMSLMLVDGSRRKHGRMGPALWIALGYWTVSGTATFAIVHWNLL